jgi:tetratricopeptide (TPR) repeat protein
MTDATAKAAKYAEIETFMLRDTRAKPDAAVLWAQLGTAQEGLMKYAQAEASFKKALEVDAKRPNPAIESVCNSGLDNIHARVGTGAGANAVSSAPDQPARGEAPAQPQYQDVAPPPPPPAPAPTISKGQSKDQVTAAFGEPERKAAAGLKEIFFYTGLKMKVTFTSGKVSSIE